MDDPVIAAVHVHGNATVDVIEKGRPLSTVVVTFTSTATIKGPATSTFRSRSRSSADADEGDVGRPRV
ncbi:MAG TPA: hypothetical protein VFH68_25810 [Polyangia bacterium]|nr:hypothetical protein [Polyangia bacterium]